MPFPVAAAIMGGSILGSGLLGGYFGSKQIDAQERINEQNMALNREMLNFQKYQYEDQKRYNSVTEQARRMRAAGLNPALLMQNGTIGSSVSAVGSPSMTPMQAPDYSVYGSIPQAFAGAAGSFADAFTGANVGQTQAGVNEATVANLEADTQGKLIDNFFASDSWRARIERWGSEALRNNAEAGRASALTDIAKLDKKYLEDTLKYRIQSQQLDTATKRINLISNMIATTYLPAQISSEIGLKIAQAKMSVQLGISSVKQATAAVMNAVTERQKSGAMYGMNETDRANFFNATMNLMSSKTGTLNAQEYNSLRTPWSTTVKAPLGLGSISHTTTEGHYTEYNAWKRDKGGYHTKGKGN